MASVISVRVEDVLKIKADKLFKDLGMDTQTAIRIFLTQSIANNGFPFEIRRADSDVEPYLVLSEEELLEQLEKYRKKEQLDQYIHADEIISSVKHKK